MKKILFATVGVLILSVASATAADIPRREAMPARAPVYVSPVYNWTGLYAGINGGYGWGNSEWIGTPGSSGSFDLSGGLVGGTLGYNYQVGQAVFGVEGDIDWSDIGGSTSAGVCAGFSCETRNNWLGTVRGRLGYAFDRVMPYVTGGLAVGDIKANLAGIGSQTTTKAGWTVGGGIEAAIAGPWTAKLEYLYVDLGNGSCDTICGVPIDVKFRTNIVRAGINYRF